MINLHLVTLNHLNNFEWYRNKCDVKLTEEFALMNPPMKQTNRKDVEGRLIKPLRSLKPTRATAKPGIKKQ